MDSLGEYIRISVELLDGENNSTLWGESYNRPRSQLYELEEYISEEIANALGIQLTGEEEKLLTKSYTGNSEAHEAYLKGKFEQGKGTEDSFRKAIQLFEEAVQKDPNYARAYAAMGYSYRILAEPIVAIAVTVGMPKAEELALKALELDSTLAEAHSLLGDSKRWYSDWTGAEKEYQLALELDPSSSEAPYGYARLMSMMGRHEEAMASIRRAQQLDPLNPAVRTSAASLLRHARRYDEAIEQCLAALDMDPNFQRAHQFLGRIYANMGLYEEAVQAQQKSLTLLGVSEEVVAGLSEAYSANGVKGYWQWWLDYRTEEARQGEYVSPMTFASEYAQLGEKEKAFEWLEKAYEGNNLGYLKVDPYLDPLRDDPRFHDLLRRMNLEP